MAYTYRPRQAPARYFEGAPDIVKRGVLALYKVTPAAPLDLTIEAAPLDFDLILRPEQITDPYRAEVIGLDFGVYGERGQYFFLTPREWCGYRDRNRRNRAAWNDLPTATQRAIVAYLKD